MFLNYGKSIIGIDNKFRQKNEKNQPSLSNVMELVACFPNREHQAY